MSTLYVKGDCKFTQEYDFAKSVGAKDMELVLDHVIDNSGVGEPDESQELIEQNYSTRLNFL